MMAGVLQLLGSIAFGFDNSGWGSCHLHLTDLEERRFEKPSKSKQLINIVCLI
jgi:hypothetical protein